MDLFMQLLYFRSYHKQLQFDSIKRARSGWNVGSLNYWLQLKDKLSSSSGFQELSRRQPILQEQDHISALLCVSLALMLLHQSTTHHAL